MRITFPNGPGAGLPWRQGGVRAASPAGQAQGDRVDLSQQAAALAQSMNRLRQLRQAAENAQRSPEASLLESMREAMEILKTCSTIAARVRAGDKVPRKDLQYLMKHNMRAYQLAMAARRPKEDPKEWKSAVPKERQAQAAQPAPAPQPAPAAPSVSEEGDSEKS